MKDSCRDLFWWTCQLSLPLLFAKKCLSRCNTRAYVLVDYKSMVAHDFIIKNRKGELKYKLFFDKHHPETITLPAPSLFDLSAGQYLVPLKAIHACRNPAPAMEPEPEPQVDPSR